MTIHVDIITPERQALSEEVDYIAAPAVDGEIGILPGHAPLLTRLGPGALRFRKGQQERYLAVSGGFLEVQQGSRVSVFAETAEFAEDIDVERARMAAEKAKTKIEQAKDLTGPELAALEASLGRAILRMKIGQGRWRKQPPMPSAH